MQVTTIGGATLDVIVSGAQWDDTSASKQDVEAICMGVGGGAVNAGLAFQACEAKVQIACALGQDPAAAWIRASLQHASIDLSLLQSVADQPTGKAVIHLDSHAEARVFTQRGASTLISPARALHAAGSADLLYVTALSSLAEAELAQTLARQDRRFALLAINPSQRQLAARTPALIWLLRQADLICVNEAEARLWSLS